jgi:hypothetical protein
MELSVLLVALVGGLLAFMASHGLDPRERRWALFAFALHLLASGGQAWLQEVYYGGIGDGLSYQIIGQAIARLLEYDIWRFAPEVLRLFFHAEPRLPFLVIGEGSSTGSMAALAGGLELVVGPSFLSLCLVTTWISWFGQLCWYRVAREELPPADKFVALLGLMLVPSVVFWGAAFAKEAIVLGAFGVVGLGSYRVFWNGRLLYLPVLIVGALGVALLKAYTLLPYVLAVATFYYVSRVKRAGSASRYLPLYFVIAGLLAFSGVAAIGSVFPEYSAENIGDTVSTQQQAWDESNGGSTIERVGGDSLGTAQEIALVPLALVNSLFRPTILEATNGPSVGAALETTLLAIAVIALLNGRSGILRALASSPLLAASTIFILVFAVAVGLTTSNLGSLSRYRVPMLPFCALVVLVIHRRRREVRVAARGEAPRIASERRRLKGGHVPRADRIP